MAMVNKTITAHDVFSDPVRMDINGRQKAQLSIFGTFVATVVVQIKDHAAPDSDWRDVDSFTVPVERIYDFHGTHMMRAGVKTGGFTSGTVKIEIS